MFNNEREREKEGGGEREKRGNGVCVRECEIYIKRNSDINK